MSNLINEKLINKITSMERDLREGLICFIISTTIIAFLGFWTNFVDNYWLIAISGDFFIYSFILVGKFSYKFNDYFSIGKCSILTTNSLLLRAIRILFYGLIVHIFFYKVQMFINVMLAIFIIYFSAGFIFYKFNELNQGNRFNKFYVTHEATIKILIIFSTLSILGIMMKLYNVYSIGGWDEGWYATITTHMFQTQNWIEPLYYDDSTGRLLLFDKPPLMFILGSVGIALFNYTTIALKWPMGVLSGLMAAAGYFIFDHQRRIDKSKFIPPLTRDEQAESSFEENLGPPEETLKTTDGKVVGIIFGLSMAVTWFLAFYGRTAYLDAAIVAITAFTALFAIKAIDHWFYGNTKRAYLYIFLTAFINMLDLLAKAWQGLIVGPSIAIYLFVKYYEYIVPRQNLYNFLQNVKKTMAINTSISKIIAMISSIVTILTFQNFLPKTNAPLNTVCTKNTTASCITFVPNSFNLFGINLNFWGIILAVFVYFGVVSITELMIQNLNNKLRYDGTRNAQNTNEFVLKNYILPLFLGISSLINGIIGAFIGEIGFQFIYNRFYVVFTEIFQTYFTYESSKSTRTFYGELVNGSFSVIFGGIVTIIFIYLLMIFLTGMLDTILRLLFKVRLFYNNFSTKIIAEWSLLVPLAFYGVLIGYWTYFLLFRGDIFHRDSVTITIVGVLFAILAYLLASFYIDFLKYCYEKVLKNDIDSNYYRIWITGINKLLIFLSVTTILIILSFYPFIAWVQYMDQYIVNNPYAIRLPGELVGVPNIPQPLSYSWLFFEYYINWRYTGKGSQYTVVDSLGGLISPLFLACIPFFITGIYAYIKKRDLGTLFFYLSWTFIVLITFIPARFQLNYYYLAIFFPYFGITSYGLFWSLRKTPTGINFKNINEKLLLSIPILLLISVSILVPLLGSLPLNDSRNFNIFIVSVIFVVGGFIACALLFTRSIPESFALAFIIFYLYRNLIGVGLGNTDSGFLLVSAILIGITIYTAKDRIPLSSAFFLFLIIMTAVSSTAWWANYKAQDDDKFQQIGEFIMSHGGNYNDSTFVFQDTGARYAMRFYLQGHTLYNDNGGAYPLSLNNSAQMDYFALTHPGLKFYVVSNSSNTVGETPSSSYTASYIWLKTHFVLIDPLLNKVSWQRVHLFANATVLSQSELNFLNSQNA